MPSINEFTLTYHAVERLAERDQEFYKLIESDQDMKIIKQKAYRFIRDAVENKSYINNTRFMIKLHEKYGYDKQYHFFILGDLILVGIIDKIGTVIVTILNRKEHKFANLHTKKIKYSKKPELTVNHTDWPKGHGSFYGLGSGRAM